MRVREVRLAAQLVIRSMRLEIAEASNGDDGCQYGEHCVGTDGLHLSASAMGEHCSDHEGDDADGCDRRQHPGDVERPRQYQTHTSCQLERTDSAVVCGV